MSTFFQRFYDYLMGPLEKKAFKTIREQLLSKANGLVLEVGSGTGVNFPLYHDVEKVTSIEPGERMREQSLPKIQKASVPIEVIDASVENMPFPDHYFDTVVATLVLCTVPNPVGALEEIKRVCKPGAKVLFFEHVRIKHSILGRMQDWLTPAWKQLCDGCHLNRDSVSLIQRAGFQINQIETYYKKIFVTIEATVNNLET